MSECVVKGLSEHAGIIEAFPSSITPHLQAFHFRFD